MVKRHPRRFCLFLSGVLMPPVCTAADLPSTGLSPEEARARLQGGQAPLVIDLCKPVEFRVGHIPGAINIPVGELLQA